MGRIPPDEEGFALGMGLSDKLDGALGDVVVDRLHALSVQRAGVLDGLLSNAAKARVLGRIVNVRRCTVQHPTRPKVLPKHRVLWIVGVLRLLLRVKVVKVAVKLVKAVNGGQYGLRSPSDAYPTAR